MMCPALLQPRMRLQNAQTLEYAIEARVCANASKVSRAMRASEWHVRQIILLLS